MKLQPLDIRRQSFAKAFRGYEPVEVDAFLKQVADQQAALMEEVRQMEDRVRDAEAKLKHYERVELALQEALETARETGKRAEATAEREMRAIVARAEARAEEILRDAERERFSLQQDVRKLSTRQTEVAAKLRGFLMSELEILAQFQGDEPVGFLKLQPASRPAALPPASLDASALDHPSDDEPLPAAAPLEDEDALVPLDAGAEDASLEAPEPETAPADDAPSETVEPAPAEETPEIEPAPTPEARPVADERAEAPLAEASPSEPASGFSRWFGGGARAADAPSSPLAEPPSVDSVPEPVVSPAEAPVAEAPAPDPSPDPVPEPVAEPPPGFAPLPSVAAVPEPSPPLWDLRSLVTGAADDANVAGSEAERDRIRRILDDLD